MPGKEPGKIWTITVEEFAVSLPRLCERQSAAMLMSTGPGDKSPRRYVYVYVGEAECYMADGRRWVVGDSGQPTFLIPRHSALAPNS